jgi:Protein of unknown function (DUF732)
MKIRLLIATAAIAVAGICSAAPAHADQDGYLKMLAGDGFPMTPDNFASMLQLGYAVCATLHTSDLSEQQAVSRILRDAPDASPQKAQLVVAAAHSQLCPDVSSSH